MENVRDIHIKFIISPKNATYFTNNTISFMHLKKRLRFVQNVPIVPLLFWAIKLFCT